MSHRVAAALVGFGVAASAGPAAAAWIAPALDGDARITELRLAHGASPTRVVLFEQLELAEVRGETAWIVEVPDGGWVEPAGRALFPALERASAPVLSPAAALGCGVLTQSTADNLGEAPPREILRSLGVVPAREAGDRLALAGFAPSDEVRKDLLARGVAKVVILVLGGSGSGTTATVRVVSGPRETFSLGRPGGRLRLFTLGSVRKRLLGRSEIVPDFASLTWGKTGHDWFRLLATANEAAGDGVVSTFGAREGVFTAGLMLTSVVDAYFGASPDGALCAKRAAAIALRGERLGAPCPRSAPWEGAAPAPECPAAEDATIPSSELGCGDADDLAAGLAGQVPRETWLTRLLGKTGGEAAISASATGTLGAFHTVDRAGAPSCGEADVPPATPPPVGTAPPAEEPAPTLDARDAEACASVAEACAASSTADGGCSSTDESASGSGCEGNGSGDAGCDAGAGSSPESCRLPARRPRLRVSAIGYLCVALAAIARRRGRVRRVKTSEERDLGGR